MALVDLPSRGVGSNPPVLLFDLGRNFGYFRFGFVEVVSGLTILGPNLDVLSGFGCFCFEEGELLVCCSSFSLFSSFVEGEEFI